MIGGKEGVERTDDAGLALRREGDCLLMHALGVMTPQHTVYIHTAAAAAPLPPPRAGPVAVVHNVKVSR